MNQNKPAAAPLRFRLHSFFYRHLTKPVLFQFDPELMHNVFTKIGAVLGTIGLLRSATKRLYNYQSPVLKQNIAGMTFRNPFGLSAGFDKNALLMPVMEDIGFGFVEVGSVTNRACAGNAGVRLKRIPEKNAIWVNLGLNNDGALAIRRRLRGRKIRIPIGVSVARTNCKATVDVNAGIEDQIQALKILKDTGDYVTLNISCPNSFGGQPFSHPKRFALLMKEVAKLGITKPIFVKLSPDLSDADLDGIISVSRKHKVTGFICSNLTKKNGSKSGGYSGKMVEGKANLLLEKVYRKTKGQFVLVGCGGVFSAEDAFQKIKLGANLVQLATGLIFNGPSLVGHLNYDLALLLKQNGFDNLSEAVGTAYLSQACGSVLSRDAPFPCLS